MHPFVQKPLFRAKVGKDLLIEVELTREAISVSKGYCYVRLTDGGQNVLFEGSPSREDAIVGTFAPCLKLRVTVFDSYKMMTVLGIYEVEF